MNETERERLALLRRILGGADRDAAIAFAIRFTVAADYEQLMYFQVRTQQEDADFEAEWNAAHQNDAH